MEKRRRDSLGELLIVIAILFIMAATAIPNLLRAAIADHQSLAVSSISSRATPAGGSKARE